MKKTFVAILLVGLVAPIGAINAQNLPVPEVYLSANPEKIFHGESTTLAWSTLYATRCSAQGEWRGNKPIIGSEKIRPLETGELEYELRCSGPGGTTVESVEIFVRIDDDEKPTLIFTADTFRVRSGRSVRFEWEAANADFCTASGGTSERLWRLGNIRTSGRQTVRPEASAPFVISCANDFGITTRQITIIVDEPPRTTIRGPLGATCIAYPEYALPKQAVTYAASAFGGNPPYTYEWSGDAEGNGITATEYFSALGAKTAELTVEDRTSRVTTSCDVEITLNPPPLAVGSQDGSDKSKSGTRESGSTNSRGSGGKVVSQTKDDSQRGTLQNPALSALKRLTEKGDGRLNLAAIGTIFADIFKIAGWGVLAIFNLILLVALALTIVSIRKEWILLRRPKMGLDEVLVSISSLSKAR